MKLRDHRFYSFFCEASATELMQHTVCRDLPQGTMLFEENTPSDCVYLVLSGKISIIKQTSEGKQEPLAEIPAGDFFGEFGVLDGKPRSAGAMAAEDSQVAAIDRGLLLEKLRSGRDDSSIKLAAGSINRIRAANQAFVENLIQKERMALLGNMLSTIVHDLRNPFAIINMATGFLQRKMDDPEVEEYCEMINDQIDRVVQMADEVLDYSRGNTIIHPATLDAADLLSEFERLNRKYLESLCIAFCVTPVSREIKGDKDRLLRVLQNLVYNATDLLDDTGKISITAENRPEDVILHVADNGPGIPESIQQTLFEAFVTEGKKKGLGLGLAISQSIVHAHGGDITFTTGPDGTVFHIRLPAKESLPESDQPCGSTIVTNSSGEADETGAASAPCT